MTGKYPLLPARFWKAARMARSSSSVGFSPMTLRMPSLSSFSKVVSEPSTIAWVPSSGGGRTSVRGGGGSSGGQSDGTHHSGSRVVVRSSRIGKGDDGA